MSSPAWVSATLSTLQNGKAWQAFFPNGREGYGDYVSQNFDSAKVSAFAFSLVLVKWRGRINFRFLDVVDGSNGMYKGPLQAFLLTKDGVPFDGGPSGSQPTRDGKLHHVKGAAHESRLDGGKDFMRIGSAGQLLEEPKKRQFNMKRMLRRGWF